MGKGRKMSSCTRRKPIESIQNMQQNNNEEQK